MRTLQKSKSVTDEKRVPTFLIDNWIRSQKMENISKVIDNGILYMIYFSCKLIYMQKQIAFVYSCGLQVYFFIPLACNERYKYSTTGNILFVKNKIYFICCFENTDGVPIKSEIGGFSF